MNKNKSRLRKKKNKSMDMVTMDTRGRWFGNPVSDEHKSKFVHRQDRFNIKSEQRPITITKNYLPLVIMISDVSFLLAYDFLFELHHTCLLMHNCQINQEMIL